MTVKEVSGKTDIGSSQRRVSLVTYSLTSLSHSRKTLFGYALKGRIGRKGFVDELGGEAVGRNNVLVPTANLDKLKEFFATWNVEFKVRNFIEEG